MAKKKDTNSEPMPPTVLILVPAAQTEWRAQGRLAGDTDLPLNEQGHRHAVSEAQAIAPLSPVAVYSAPEQATRQTADIIAHELNLKVKSIKDLCEMDLGHWEGLTNDDFRDRFARVYRMWRNEPMSVEPPEGEAVAHVAVRLSTGLQKIVKRSPGEKIVLTLGQFAYAIVRCQLEDVSYEHFWEYVDGDPSWCAIEVESAAAVEAAASLAAADEEAGDA